MSSSTTQQEMVVSITVKNTFLNIKKIVEEPVRRSSSVPRTFKPGDSGCSDWPHSDDSTHASDKDVTEHYWPHSDDSTNASDKDVTENSPATSSDSEQDYPDYRSDCTDDTSDFAHPCGENLCVHSFGRPAKTVPADENTTGKVTLSLSDMVTEGTVLSGKGRSKLRSQAQPFKSVRAPPAEVTSMVEKAVETLSKGEHILDVQVQDGGMGGTTMIVAKSSSSNPDALWIFSLVKDSLLNSAEQSESTYILGYGAQPFKNLDSLSFSANIGCVPTAHQNSVCWDTYEKGFCAQKGFCCWHHPSDADMMRIIVIIKPGA